MHSNTNVTSTTNDNGLYRVDDTGVCPDNSTLFLSPEAMQKINANPHDVVLVRNKNKFTCGIVLPDNELENNKIKLNKTLRLNSKAKLSDNVYPVSFTEIRFAKYVNILPYADTISSTIQVDLTTHLLQPYFVDQYRPICKNDQFICNANMLSVEFKVVDIVFEGKGVSIDPSSPILQKEFDSCCIVGPETEIRMSGDPILRDKEESLKQIGYEDIGGCKHIIKQLREICELPIKFPEIFATLGTEPPKGVLFHGPPGTGKTLMAKAIANECGCYFRNVNAPEIVAAQPGMSEKMLAGIFEDAKENAPAIIFIDEIDSITQKRDKINSELEKRIVAQLLILMDGLADRGQVIVIGATNRPNTMDPALRRSGRFDREIHIGVPDTEGREEILKIHTKSMKLSEDVNIKKLANDTHGFVGADIKQLCSDAGMHVINTRINISDWDYKKIDMNVLASLFITNDDFVSAKEKIAPAALRETVIEKPNVSWDDIGGLGETKQNLIETIQYPIQNQDLYTKFGTKSPSGTLLYGPPGCGKTMIAKALATGAGMNFISVKGPEFFNMWVGESEAKVREVFDKARQAAPCILFIDEIDAVAGSRNSGNHDSGVSERTVMQLLTEMDGMGGKKNVFVIGATNRPWALDTAIMRPGRLGTHIYIPLPDYVGRLSILQACLRNTPMGEGIILEKLANATTGYSGADLTAIVQHAVKNAIRELVEESRVVSVPYVRKSMFEELEYMCANLDYDGFVALSHGFTEYNIRNVIEKCKQLVVDEVPITQNLVVELINNEAMNKPPVMLMPYHIENAMDNVHKSVPDDEIQRFLNFAHKEVATKKSGFRFDSDTNQIPLPTGGTEVVDDLYS